MFLFILLRKIPGRKGKMDRSRLWDKNKGKIAEKGGLSMRQEEKKPTPWEMKDPKPPVVRSGHMENRKEN